MLETVRVYAKRTDKVYLLLCLFSSAMAVLMLASWAAEQGGGFAVDEITGQITGIGDYRRALVQAGASGAGVLIALLLSTVDYRSLVKVWPFHVAFTWGLVLPNNVRSRINEPRELAKLLAHLMAPILLIHIQGDDGTAIIYGIIGCCMMFTAGLSWKYIVAALSAAIAAVSAAFLFLSDSIGKSYQWYRILAVIDPENATGWAPSEDVWRNIVYQQDRGEVALGAGGIFGNGMFSGEYYSVPNAHNDFIFSWVGNALGFVGCMVVLGVLIALVIRTFAVGGRSEDMLGSFICAGVGGALLAQIAVNVGMNLRLLPVIGVTLPFYSAGGSSVLMLYICVGLVLSVHMHNKKKLFG